MAGFEVGKYFQMNMIRIFIHIGPQNLLEMALSRQSNV